MTPPGSRADGGALAGSASADSGQPVRWRDLGAPISYPNSLGWKWAARNALGMGPYLALAGFIVSGVIVLVAPDPLWGLAVAGAVGAAIVVGAAAASLRLAAPMTPRWVTLSGDSVTVGGWPDRSQGAREFPLSKISAVHRPGWRSVGQGKGMYWAYAPHVIDVEGSASDVAGVRELRERSYNLAEANAGRLHEAFRGLGLPDPTEE